MSDSEDFMEGERVLEEFAEMRSWPDPRLYDLVVMVNQGFSTPVTVSVSGIIYSGTMVSEKEWLEENLKLVQLSDFEHKQSNIDYYNKLIDDFRREPERTAMTLHMKNVKIISHPSADMPVFLWRIRIDRVDAFHVGRMP
ncbi:hypothetical protein ABQJ53_01710 [Morganella morganii]|uniref:hypothetical protein n=1 Tax=Morganella morganii TaxID=582 RepID=UPI003F2862B1